LQLNNFEARVIGQNFAHIKEFIIFALMLQENPKKLIFFFTSRETLKNLATQTLLAFALLIQHNLKTISARFTQVFLIVYNQNSQKVFLNCQLGKLKLLRSPLTNLVNNEWTHFANSTENCLSIPLKLLLKQNCFATCLLIIPHHNSFYWQLHKMLFVDSWATNVIIICLWSFSFQSKQFALNNFLFTHIL